MTKNPPLSHEEIRKIISRSGYLEEQKVVVEFEKQGFSVGANFAFEDQDEHKSREIDLIATKYKDFSFGKTGFYFLTYGEVKKKSNPLIFFERKPQKREHLEVFIPIVGTQEYFPNIELFLDIKKILKFPEIHHQANHDFISTQFCEIDKKKAEHKNLYESLFVPLLKCLDSEVSSIQKMTSSFRPADPSYFLHVFQPILIISGPLHAYDINTDSIAEKNYILYKRHYSSKTIKRTLLVDIVTKDYLPQYLSEKLIKTYESIQNSFENNIKIIIEHCSRDHAIQNQKRSY